MYWEKASVLHNFNFADYNRKQAQHKLCIMVYIPANKFAKHSQQCVYVNRVAVQGFVSTFVT